MGLDMGYGLNGLIIRMGISFKKELTRMARNLENGLIGGRMDRKRKKGLTRKGRNLENGLGGGRMDKSFMKELTRMG